MSERAAFDRLGRPIFLVVYDDGQLHPYAVAFSRIEDAQAYAGMVDGQVIETGIDRHLDAIEGEENASGTDQA